MNQLQPTLLRVLGPWTAAAIVVGTVIGSGVYKKARNVSENVPEFGLALSVWVVGGVLTLLGALALAEVAVLFPRAGGNYVFLREGYGRMAGFVWGWVEFWIIRAASIAALATMFTESFHDLLNVVVRSDSSGVSGDAMGFWPRQAFTIAVILALATVNARGTRIGGGLQLLLTVVKVGSLLFIVALPFAVLAAIGHPQHPPKVEHLSPTWPADWSSVNWGMYGSALVGVLWAYDGWMNVALVAEEVRAPARNIPRALLGGVVLLIALYCGANLAYYLVIPREQIATMKDTPVATRFCLQLLGPVGGVLASTIIVVSVFGALNGNLLVGPRLLFAMGKDGLAPKSLQRIHTRYGTPAIATAVLTAWACILVIGAAAMTKYRLPVLSLGFANLDLNLPAGKALFDVVTDFAIFGTVTLGTLAVASIFVFRWRIPPTTENRPYRCWGYPVVPAVYVLGMSAVAANMFVGSEQRSEAVIGMGFIGLGIAVYLCLFGGGRRR